MKKLLSKTETKHLSILFQYYKKEKKPGSWVDGRIGKKGKDNN